MKKARGSVYAPKESTRRSLKVQAHYNIVSAIKEEDETTYKEDDYKTPQRFNLKRYLDDKVIVPVIQKDSDIINYQKYLEKNNIFVADTMKTFNEVKSLLFDNKLENFKMMDYKEFLPEIIKIQSLARAFKYKNKYKVYR